MGDSQREARETAKRLSRTVGHREGGFPGAGLRASAPHTAVSPRRRLYQRAAHAWGGVTGKLGGNLRGIEDAIKKPPARVSYGKQSTGLFSYFPALADATKTVGRCPTTRQLSFVESWAKNFTRLRRARALVVRTDAAFSRRPLARIVPRGHAPRIAWGATPAN